MVELYYRVYFYMNVLRIIKKENCFSYCICLFFINVFFYNCCYFGFSVGLYNKFFYVFFNRGYCLEVGFCILYL